MYPHESGCDLSQQLTCELNHLLRRFRQYQTEAEWVSALLDGASQFARQAAVLTLKDGVLLVRGQVNLAIPDHFAFPVSSTAAFASAVESKDPVIALRTPGEVSERLSAPEPDERAHIIPISNGDRVVAVLFAAGAEPVNGSALELVAGMASIVLERQANASLHAQIARHLGTSS
ncbi:MAG TPA: hypothetical protein VMF91_14875 [Bryobacteraceae bacterium]|nr:hypothetical protein [Bryobacteraceae bacterium]